MPIAFERDNGELEWDLSPDTIARCGALLLGSSPRL
jgi:hypothetical protein